MLEVDNRIKKMRNNAHGTKKFQFTNNNQYYKFNGKLAKKKFLESFKQAFQKHALTKEDLDGFIFEI
jgi:hypothetical protein